MRHALLITGILATTTTSLLAQGQATAYGDGCGSGAHAAPALSTLGAPTDGQQFELRLDAGPSATLGLLFVGLSSTQLPVGGHPGCDLLVVPAFSISLPMPPGGHLSVPAPGFGAGVAVHAQAAVAYGPAVTFSNGLTLVGGAAPSQPTISSIDVTEGGVGTSIGLGGGSLPSAMFDAVDAVIYAPGAAGYAGVVEELNQTGAKARVTSVSKYAESQPFTLVFGDGFEGTPPNLGSPVHFPKARRLLVPPGAPDATSGVDFDPVGDLQFGQCDGCGESVRLKVADVDAAGAVSIQLPGKTFSENPLAKGDVVTGFLQLGFQNGDKLFAFVPPSTPLAASYSWAIAGPSVAAVLSFVMLPDAAASYDIATNRISIVSINPSNPIVSVDPQSHVRIDFDMAEHTVTEVTMGIPDGFTGGIEPNGGDPALEAGILNCEGVWNGIRDYDEAGADAWFVEQFQLATVGPVRAVRLEMLVKAVSGLSYTDGIVLEAEPGGAACHGYTWGWSSSVESLPQFDYQWLNGQTRYICLDLTELPYGAKGFTRSLVDALHDGVLDVVIADDTMVDYLKLCVVRD